MIIFFFLMLMYKLQSTETVVHGNYLCHNLCNFKFGTQLGFEEQLAKDKFAAEVLSVDTKYMRRPFSNNS